MGFDDVKTAVLTPPSAGSLEKDESKRPKYTSLLQHAFIRRSEADCVDVAGYVNMYLDAVAHNMPPEGASC